MKKSMYQLTTVNFEDKSFKQYLMYKEGIQAIIQPHMFLNDDEINELVEKGKLLWRNYGVICNELNEFDEHLLYDYYNQPSELDIQESEENQYLA